MSNSEAKEGDGDEGDKLPPLASIWDCSKLDRVNIVVDSKSVAGWTCSWCPSADGHPQFFKSVNATKALYHVLKMNGGDIRRCLGVIPDDYMARYRDLYMRKLSAQEERTARRDELLSKISDIQESTTLESARSSSAARQVIFVFVITLFYLRLSYIVPCA